MQTTDVSPAHPDAVRRELAEQLRAERARLRQAVAALERAELDLAESQGDESGAGGQQADVASDLAEAELDLSLAGHERARLSDVDAALERLDAGTYGRCLRCGAVIAEARLHALPWTATCVACASSAA